MQTVATPLRHRRVLVVSGLAALLVLTALVSLAVGARPIGVGAVWQALWTPSGTEEDERREHERGGETADDEHPPVAQRRGDGLHGSPPSR